MNTIFFSYHLGQSTVHKIVRETCEINTTPLIKKLMPILTQELKIKIATDFIKCKISQMYRSTSLFRLLLTPDQFFLFAKKHFRLFCQTLQMLITILLLLIQRHMGKIVMGEFLTNQSQKKHFTEAFLLKAYLMRPNSGNNFDGLKRNCNYRLCHAKRTFKNTFGIFV